MALIRKDAARVDYFGVTKINLETDTVASSDDILDGKKGHLRDGSVVDGTHPNFATFPLVCRATQTYNVTLDEDSDEFPLQAFDLGGREIKFIGISAASVSLSTTETTVQTRYIVSLLYSADRLLIATNATNFLGYCLRVGRTSTSAYAYGTSGAGSYFAIQDEELLSTGGATIKSRTPSTAGYFKAGLNYHVFIGG